MSRLEAVEGSVHLWASGGGRSNATVIADGDQVVLVDALTTPSAASKLEAACRERFGRGPTLLVLTHYHGDHHIGAAGLSERPIVVAHAATKTFLNKHGANERQRIIDADPDLADELTDAGAIAPTISISAPTTVHAGSREVALLPLGPAHTPSDLVVHVPEDGVVVAGDVVFSGYLPVMVEAAVDGWLAALDQLEALHPRHVVPGHGPAGHAEAIGAMRSYLSELLRQVQRAVAAGLDVEQTVAAVDLPPDFSDWGRQDRLTAAVGRLHQELAMTDGPISEVGSKGSTG